MSAKRGAQWPRTFDLRKEPPSEASKAIAAAEPGKVVLPWPVGRAGQMYAVRGVPHRYGGPPATCPVCGQGLEHGGSVVLRAALGTAWAHLKCGAEVGRLQ